MACGLTVAVPTVVVPDFRKSATAELSAVLDRLVQAADGAARTAREKATAEAQLAIDTLTAERTALQQTVREHAEARAALDRTVQEAAEARQALEQALREQTDARQALAQSHAALNADKAEALKRAESLAAVLEAVRSESDHARRDWQSKLDAADQLLAEAAAQADDAAARAAAAAADADERHSVHLRTVSEQATAFVSRTLDRMLAVSTAFADVTSEDEVLATVVEALATEFSRVVLFKAGLNRLDVVRHVGFDFPSDPTHLVIPHVIDAVIGRAVTSGQIEMMSGDALGAASGTPFGGSPACAIALPIDLVGDACAVLYADDAGLPQQAFAQTELRRTFALLLRQFASPLLLRLPAEMKAIGELREYAAHLVAELENMYAADVGLHRKGADLRRRLQDNLECARGIYAQRVSSEAPAAGALLEEELALAASVSHGTPFGRDLTTLLGERKESVKS